MYPRVPYTSHTLYTYLLVVKVGLEPIEHHSGRQCEPEVHETQAPDVRRVGVVEQT